MWLYTSIQLHVVSNNGTKNYLNHTVKGTGQKVTDHGLFATTCKWLDTDESFSGNISSSPSYNPTNSMRPWGVEHLFFWGVFSSLPRLTLLSGSNFLLPQGLTSKFWIVYSMYTKWTVSGPQSWFASVCFRHWILRSALTLAHGAMSVVSHRVLCRSRVMVHFNDTQTLKTPSGL